ncbi:hypothetical protein ASG11_05435 [Sphingomonas sp. Leaf357]|nr:hypothetical protein ASG11_05435 [Sphingomonas sp. Leaf357]
MPQIYYGTERIWANLAYRSSEWMNVVGGYNSVGNPNTAGRIYLAAPNAVYSGQSTAITCTWEGAGIAHLGGMSQTTYGDHTATVVWVPQGVPGKHGVLWFDLSQSDGTFRNLDCREAGVVANGRLDQRYVDDMKLYGVIRFLDWSNANNNLPITWATRALPGTAYVNEDQPLEDQIEIANAAGADAWFTVPWNADDDYVRRMATLIRDTLKGKAYFETSNEVWNWAFKVTTQALNEGLAENLSPDRWTNVMLRYAEKTVEQNKIITDIFKAQPTRLVRVASFQSGNTPGIDQFMAFRDTAQWVDALADAPYFGTEVLNTETPTALTLADLFALVETARVAAIGHTTNVAASAKAYGKLSMIYEGGQGTVSTDVNAAINEEMQRSPLMGAAYDRYLADLKAVHTGPLMLYNATGTTTRYGSWGQHEYTGQASPKRRAILDAIAK